jgi:hypothetical protein
MVIEVMTNMSSQVIVKAYKRFWSRIKAVIDNDGDFFEQIIPK